MRLSRANSFFLFLDDVGHDGSGVSGWPVSTYAMEDFARTTTYTRYQFYSGWEGLEVVPNFVPHSPKEG